MWHVGVLVAFLLRLGLSLRLLLQSLPNRYLLRCPVGMDHFRHQKYPQELCQLLPLLPVLALNKNRVRYMQQINDNTIVFKLLTPSVTNQGPRNVPIPTLGAIKSSKI